MPTRYTPQFLWLLMGPILGFAAGATVGTTILVGSALAASATSGDSDVVLALPVLVIAGTLVGGFLGAIAGFFAGLPFIFLVGRHLPRPVAKRRALVLGAVVSPPATLAMFAVISGDASWLADGVLSSDVWSASAWLLASSVLGGPLAAWAAGKDEQSSAVS